jgi:SAM-dependent methyltransferase
MDPVGHRPKPRHLGPEYGAQFADPSVVAAYPKRPPYPEAVFDLLAEFAGERPRTVALDLGAGTGDITWRLAKRVAEVDAVEPSNEMIAAALARNQNSEEVATNVRWFASTAEDFEAPRRYSLVVAGESLHWMEWDRLLPRIAGLLEPDGVLAVVVDRILTDLPWRDALLELISDYSTNQVYQRFDLAAELTSRGLFRERGRRTCIEPSFSQSVHDYVESFHSRNGFSRDRMDAAATARFDAEVLRLVLRHCPGGIVSGAVQSTVFWGSPSELTPST